MPSLYDNLNFNFLRDIAPVASIMRTPMVMEVNAALPIKTVAEFIAYAKANPGKLNFASSGNGTGSHVAAELFKFMTGVDIVHVPYRGPAQALTDLISGRVQVRSVGNGRRAEGVGGSRVCNWGEVSAIASEVEE